MNLKTNVLAYLEESAANSPESVAVCDAHTSLTYAELLQKSRLVGTTLAHMDVRGHSVVVLMEKSCETLCALMGILQAGASYVPVDPNVPQERLTHILHLLDRPLVIVDQLVEERTRLLGDYDGRVSVFDDLVAHEVDEGALAAARAATIETDPAYVLFTSGSTGVPKGVVISHRAILSFIDTFVSTLGICETDRIANQAPFDFDVSTKDIYSTLATGATLVIVPRELFMQPAALVAFLSEHQVTVLIWAVAALCIVSTYHALDHEAMASIRLVSFSGEVMPLKHLAQWRAALPEASFVNLYGPTEITCNCLYHKLDPERSYDEGIPLGTNFAHCGVLIIGKDGAQVTKPDVEGEIVVRGPSVGLGYVGNREQTEVAFGQNPLNDRYADRVYHTGDLAAYSTAGELFFRGRKDNQIKYQGHRIELEEIELAVERIDGVERCRCTFDNERKRLRGFYEGRAEVSDVREIVAQTLPTHMRPSTLTKVDEMPLTKNGKVDRAKLLQMGTRRGARARRGSRE